jgi:ribosomal protein S27E
MENKKKRVTLIPYGFLVMMGLYLISYFFEEGSGAFKIISILAFISLIVMIIHAIRLINQYLKYISYQNWKRHYIERNPEHSKTDEELQSIFYEEKNNAKQESIEAMKKAKLEKDKKKLENTKEMERLRNAGRTVLPSEQVSYQSDHDSNAVRCPKCGSTSITANKKGFSLAKGALGVATVGAYGAVAAGHGKNKVLVTCLNCGKQWKPGK